MIAAAVLVVFAGSAPAQRQFDELGKRGLPHHGDTRATALGDVDGDGDVDLVVGNTFAQQDRLYLNNGAGKFTDATASRMPVDTVSVHIA